jgi:inhibitor of KinA sporulation pathway (predicted exonuclease)
MYSRRNYDKNHFISECEFFELKNPVNAYHLNLKSAFAQKLRIKRCGLQKALEYVGFTFIGQHHRGIDDTRNITQLLDLCI